jgi:phosphate transport system protein
MEQRILLEKELNVLRDRVLLLGGEVELALQRAVHSLIQRDSGVAHQVLENDRVINCLELDIDRLCIDVLALRRPVGKELRTVISIAKITPLLERIGDHATSIAKAALKLNDEPELNAIDLGEMTFKTSELLRNSLDAFTSNNSEQARKLIEKDAEIDSIYNRLFTELVGMMSEDASKSSRLTELIFVTKNLERIGDYVKDICELTVYMKEAVFIKHSE